jgi:hypothetical protein
MGVFFWSGTGGEDLDLEGFGLAGGVGWFVLCFGQILSGTMDIEWEEHVSRGRDIRKGYKEGRKPSQHIAEPRVVSAIVMSRRGLIEDVVEKNKFRSRADGEELSIEQLGKDKGIVFVHIPEYLRR